MCDDLLDLKDCNFQCRLNCLLSFTPCDICWDEILLEYKNMIVSLRDYCKQLKARIALMQKNFDCVFMEAVKEKTLDIRRQVEHHFMMELHYQMACYKSKLDLEYDEIITTHLHTWESIAFGEIALMPESVHDLHQTQLDVIQFRHEKEMCEAASEASCLLEKTRHEYEAIVWRLEQVVEEMHIHHVESLLRLKRRFLCSPEEVNCSDLEFWKIPDVPVEDECCGVDHCVVNYSRWEALSVEVQALPQDQQLSVLTHACISPDVVGRFIALSTQ